MRGVARVLLASQDPVGKTFGVRVLHHGTLGLANESGNDLVARQRHGTSSQSLLLAREQELGPSWCRGAAAL